MKLPINVEKFSKELIILSVEKEIIHQWLFNSRKRVAFSCPESIVEIELALIDQYRKEKNPFKGQ